LLLQKAGLDEKKIADAIFLVIILQYIKHVALSFSFPPDYTQPMVVQKLQFQFVVQNKNMKGYYENKTPNNFYQ